MLKHYFTVAFRNIARQKLYSAINITGLAIGLAAFLLIFLFVRDELSYDRFYPKADRIYRVLEKINLDGQGEHSSSCPFPVATTLRNDYPHLMDGIVRFFNFQDDLHSFKYNNTVYNEHGIFFVDSTVFRVLDYQLLEGDVKTALVKPGSVVLTRELARKYFGNDKPMGKLLKFDGGTDMIVTGIMADIPTQSHLRPTALISFTTLALPGYLGQELEKQWVWNPCWTYVLLKEGVTQADFEKQFPAYVQKYYPNHLKKQVTHSLQPISSIHLYSHLDYEIGPNNDASNVLIFGLAGIFILLIACINFMNMATARSAMRSKEVGIRKVAGAHRAILIRQFLSEAIVLTSLAALVALVAVELLLPFFNQVANKSLTFYALADTWFIVVTLITIAATGIVSGIYPAFVLSSFEPVKVLKGKMLASGNISLRKALVVMQFTISVCLIIGSVIVYRQLQLMQAANLGFDKEHILMLPVRPPMADREAGFNPFIDNLLQSRFVKDATVMNDVIGVKHNTHEFFYDGMDKRVEWFYMPALMVDEHFVPTMGMQVIAGRNFSKDFPRDDSLAVIINESMARQAGWTPDEAIGKLFHSRDSPSERVVGVVKDFNAVSLRKPIGPFILDMVHPFARRFWTRYIAVKLEAGNTPEMLGDMKKRWKEFMPEYPFEYFFLDSKLNQQYASQQNLSYLMACFTILAIFIACLGLFALASFMTEQRTKEIGIRKILGAETSGIVGLLSKEFLIPIIIANLIAWPLSWYILHEWLNNFAYRTPISWYIFLSASLVIGLIAQVTIMIKTWRAAVGNPVKSLRYE